MIVKTPGSQMGSPAAAASNSQNFTTPQIHPKFLRIPRILLHLNQLSDKKQSTPTIDWFWDPIFRTNWNVRGVDKLSWDLIIHWGKWAIFVFVCFAILVQSAHLWISQPNFQNQSIGKLALFEKSCHSGKEEARTGWSNVDKGPQKIGCKSHSLHLFDSKKHNAFR